MPKTDRELSTITLDEWIEIVSRLYELIHRALDSFEDRLKETNRINRLPLNDADTRRLNTITRTIEKVHTINKIVVADEVGLKAKKAIRESNEAGEEFKRRIARYTGKRGT